jgi:hypothetical protein
MWALLLLLNTAGAGSPCALPAGEDPALWAEPLALGGLDDHRELGLVGRAAVVELCGEELSNVELQALLERSAPTIRRLRQVEVPGELVRAARLQMEMRRQLRDRRADAPTPQRWAG